MYEETVSWIGWNPETFPKKLGEVRHVLTNSNYASLGWAPRVPIPLGSALYGLRERELVLDLFEAASGSRMMCNYMRFGGVMADLPPVCCCFMNGMWPPRSTSFSKRRKNPVVQHAPIA